MKKFNLMALISTLLLSLSSYAATLEVTFTEPDKYADIRSGDNHSTQFKENVFYNFEKELSALAEKLPESYLLKIEFTDIDLAGDINMLNGRLMRVVKQVHSPRLAYSYQLTDKNKKALATGEENIRDTSFMSHQKLKYRRDPLGYEKQLLAEWFEEAFESHIK